MTLGILAAAIAAGTDFFSSSSTKESDRAQAAAMIEYAASLKIVVERLLANGCDETQLDFRNSVWIWQNNALMQPTNPSALSTCKVFLQNGAAEGILARTFPGGTWPVGSGYMTPGHGRVILKNIANVGTTGSDLVLNFVYLAPGLCKEINRQLNGSTTIPTSTTGTTGQYTGSFSTSLTTLSGTNITGKMQSCFYWPGESVGQFLAVLIAR